MMRAPGSDTFELVAPPPPGGLRGVLWRCIGAPLVCHSFHNWYGFRRRLLGLFGAHLDPTARIRPGLRIDRPWNLTMARKASIGDACTLWAEAPIALGERSVVSQYSILSTWAVDADASAGPTRRVEPVEIGADAWVATECLVGAGSRVPPGVVVGARSTVRADGLEPWTVASGDPARSRAPRPWKGPRP